MEGVGEYPAVVVEQVDDGVDAEVLVYDDAELMQDVAEEQEVETETVETGNSHRHTSGLVVSSPAGSTHPRFEWSLLSLLIRTTDVVVLC